MKVPGQTKIPSPAFSLTGKSPEGAPKVKPVCKWHGGKAPTEPTGLKHFSAGQENLYKTDGLARTPWHRLLKKFGCSERRRLNEKGVSNV
jgi:hypothetical protein